MARRVSAHIGALAAAGERHIYFHAINRSFDKSTDVTIDVSAFASVEDSAVHHVLQGRLNNEPGPNEPRQIGRISESPAYFDGKTLKIAVPHRSVSAIEFTRK